jgi:Spy/CpxP family protein refolding chaperone
MKNTKQTLILTLALAMGGLVASAPLTRAADDTPKEDAKGKKGAMADRFKQMAEKLELTDDQKAKMAPIREEEMTKLKALRDDTSIERPAKMGKYREILEASNTKIKAILTPDQSAKFDKFMEDARAKRKKKDQ